MTAYSDAQRRSWGALECGSSLPLFPFRGRSGSQQVGGFASSPAGLARWRRMGQPAEGTVERQWASVVGILASSPLRQLFWGAAPSGAQRPSPPPRPGNLATLGAGDQMRQARAPPVSLSLVG